MKIYRYKRFRALRIVAMLMRGLGQLLGAWPLLLIATFLVSPVGPHLRAEYTYEQRGSHRQMIACRYLGSRGWVDYVRYGECPVIVILDRRKH